MKKNGTEKECKSDISSIIISDIKETEKIKTPTSDTKPYESIRVSLTEDELIKNANTISRILIADLNNTKKELSELRNELSNCKDLYHQSDKDKAVLEECLQHITIGFEIYDICLAIGSILVGGGIPSNSYPLILIGLLLMISAVITKYQLKRRLRSSTE